MIAVEYTSGDPRLAAEIANKLADVYIGWQRTAKIEQTKDATVWLDDQIKALRKPPRSPKRRWRPSRPRKAFTRARTTSR
ncbi:hypothetical protein AUC71_08685 [Methyloceanibacter marginalis]|uniref:Uncharacterized protein n=1 Tax=Methyloceanibacter marginalis TaxID=1774971 RepID=A0A1E3WCW1_9HYPH|nr:hypothetical protein AUC71_08685 [Methyloceanibacter marginalis]